MKPLYTLLCLAFFQANVIAQSVPPVRQWRFGILAGRPLAGKIQDNEKMMSASGLVAGLDVGYNLEKRGIGPSIHVQPGFSTFKRTQTSGEKGTQYYFESKWKWEAIHCDSRHYFMTYVLTNAITCPSGSDM